MNLRNFRYILKLIFNFLSSVVSLDGVKDCLADQSGGLVLPIDGITIEDKDWIKYQSLKVDKTVKSINPKDLPEDFGDEACRLVDEFRKKTVNEKVEWLLYFDYKTGEVIYCWEGEKGKCGGVYDKLKFKGRNIASIHSHSGCYSFPSPDNFDILENDFEDYEIITSTIALWVVKFRGMIQKDVKENFQFKMGKDIENISSIIKLDYLIEDIDKMTEKIIGNYLLSKIDKELNGVELVLTKVEFD